MLMGSCKSVQSTSLLKDFWKRQRLPYEGKLSPEATDEVDSAS